MSEIATEKRRPIDAGDVYTMNVPHAAFVFLVMSKDEEVLDETHGAKVYFRWLAHPDASMLTRCEWLYESTIRAKSGNGEDAWTLVASAD